MDAVEQQKKTAEGYTRMVLDSEQEKLPILDSISQVIDTFGKDQETMTKLSKDIDKLEQEKVAWRELIDDMDRSKRTLGALEERYTELNKPLQYSESKQKELFEKYMGLKFKLTEDRAISIVFTNINPQDHNQRYVITVDVDEQNQWKIVHLQPSVHGVLLLLNDLNQTNNFSKFCKGIRQKFQQLCSTPTVSSSN